MTTLSVILPNYNHARELATALGALIGQTRLPDEIIVIDDGSIDDSVAVIESFRARCPTIRLVRLARNGGVVAALNRGLAEVRGDCVMFASADERVAPDMCGAMLAALQAFPRACLAVSAHTEWFPDRGEVREHDAGSELGMWYVGDEVPEFVDPARFHRLLARRYVALGIHTAMFRRDALAEVGGFDPAMRWHSDWFVIYTIAFRRGFVAVPRHFAWYRVTEQSYSFVGVCNGRAQQKVALAIQARLDRQDLADVRAALARSPQAMSPVMRATLIALIKRPHRWGRLFPVLRFWIGEVAQGRRPGSLARILGRLDRGPSIRRLPAKSQCSTGHGERVRS